MRAILFPDTVSEGVVTATLFYANTAGDGTGRTATLITLPEGFSGAEGDTKMPDADPISSGTTGKTRENKDSWGSEQLPQEILDQLVEGNHD